MNRMMNWLPGTENQFQLRHFENRSGNPFSIPPLDGQLLLDRIGFRWTEYASYGEEEYFLIKYGAESMDEGSAVEYV